MNLHPIIVHFPIALLILYSLLEVISLLSPSLSTKLYTTKTICLWIGTLGSFAALMSGEVAQDLIGKSALIHTHEERAEKSHSIYTILSIYYIIKTVIEQKIGAKYRSSITQQYMSQIQSFFSSRWTAIIVSIISIIGVGLLTVVGALGGAIVRGTNTGDPVSDRAVQTLVPQSTIQQTGSTTPQPTTTTVEISQPNTTTQ